jgi:hypothetical protein
MAGIHRHTYTQTHSYKVPHLFTPHIQTSSFPYIPQKIVACKTVKSNNQKLVFKILRAARMKMPILWVVATCSLVEVY